MRVPVNVIPLAFTGALATFMLLPRVRQDPRLFWSFAAAATVLLLWHAVLNVTRRRRHLAVDVVVRKQHYIQACAQGSVLLYRGWYWKPVYDHAYLIAAQLLFAYPFCSPGRWAGTCGGTTASESR